MAAALVAAPFATAAAESGTVVPNLPQSNWKPDRPVEFVVQAAAGGGSDLFARTMADIMTKEKIVGVPVNVVNKPGGSGTIGLNYLNQHPGDGHYIIIATTGSITNHILGLIPYNHTAFTPLAMLFDEYLGVNVRADSAIASGRDLIARLKQDPQSVSFGVSTSLGGGNHTTLTTCLRAGGVDIKRLKTAIFPGGAATTTALLGGHVDAINTGLGNMVAHLRSGKLRTLAISAPKRMWGDFASVPTWREQGVPADSSSWRGLMGPKGLSAEQTAYWDKVFAALARTEEWQKDLEANFWVNGYANAQAARKRLDEEYAEYKAVLTELGLAKIK
ncbi:MAG TPA: tripartite tricarboxylate transporter substrate binding protein [Burkholderiales bacterium]|nr:tripartite tricarboxylate transporter substrate binding protein [Burkholderiales bacterium]